MRGIQGLRSAQVTGRCQVYWACRGWRQRGVRPLPLAGVRRLAVSGLTIVGTSLSSVAGMFTDASVVGCSWDALAGRLDRDGVIARWSAEPELAGIGCVADLVSAWRDPARTHLVGDALARLSAVDGGDDADALLVVLHLASPVVWRLVGRLRDLDPDITSIVTAELCCQVRCYRWRTRRGGLLTNLELDTRAAVLAELRPSDRYHPERVERVTDDGDIARLVTTAPEASQTTDGQLVEVLCWAVDRGVNCEDINLLLACQRARGRRGDLAVAAAHQMSVRTLYRRRARVLDQLRAAAGDLLAASA